MHKYQPRIHVIHAKEYSTYSLRKGLYHTFVFQETQFMGVTAYQNPRVSYSECSFLFVYWKNGSARRNINIGNKWRQHNRAKTILNAIEGEVLRLQGVQTWKIKIKLHYKHRCKIIQVLVFKNCSIDQGFILWCIELSVYIIWSKL